MQASMCDTSCVNSCAKSLAVSIGFNCQNVFKKCFTLTFTSLFKIEPGQLEELQWEMLGKC